MNLRSANRRFLFSQLMLVGFVALSGCSKEPSLPEGQQAVADEIKQLGGLASSDKEHPEWGIVAVNLQGTEADDALVPRLEAFPELQFLSLVATHVTDASVKPLMKLTKLKELDVSATSISLKGFKALQAAFPNATVTSDVANPVE